MKINKVYIVAVYFMLGLLLFLSVFAGIKYSLLLNEIEYYKNRVLAMENQIKADDIEIKKLKNEITGLNQLVENLTIENQGMALFINDLKSRCLSLEAYSEAAEYILINLGIDFRKSE